jgi:hypothetical protein
MSPLRIQRYIPDNDAWSQVVDVNGGDPDVSISANNPDGSRDVYLFGVDTINHQGYIRRSIGGIDEADPDVRVIDSLGFVTVATLNSSESYELVTVTDKSKGEPRRLRFTYFRD